MNREQSYKVLLGPHLSEKTAQASQRHNQYVFRVARSATKPEIRRTVERLFDVKVHLVRVLNVRGKTVRNRFGAGRRNHWKKAYVSLQSGQSIDLAASAGN